MAETPELPPPPPLRILVIDDEANIRSTLSICLEIDGHTVSAQSNISDALEEISKQVYDLVFLDLRLGMDNGMDFLPQLRAENPWAKVVVITAFASVETAVQAMKYGATDYLAKPFDAPQVQLLTRKIAEQRQLELRMNALQASLDTLDSEANLPTNSPAMRAVIDMARQVAPSAAPLLIRGELGTGHGRLARAIHGWSRRASGPFVEVSCRQNSDALEAELFGVSSAIVQPGGTQLGKIAACETGTLLLRDIGQTPPHLQPKLLELIQHKQYERMDEAHWRKIDVRIIASTDEDLSQMILRGTFRRDLQMALDVVQLEIPALRNRSEDIELLADRYLASISRQNARTILSFSSDALFALKRYSWPGNLRELRSVVERAVLICHGEQITIGDLPPNLLNSSPAYSIGDLVPLETIKRLHIRKVLASTRSIRRAAAILGIDSSTLCRLLKRYDKTSDQPVA